VHQLLAELDRQNAEIDQLRGSMHRASNSRLSALGALGEHSRPSALSEHSRPSALSALSDTRDRLALAVEAAGLALWEWDLNSPDVRLSARWGEMVGDVAAEGYWNAQELRERVHPDDRERVESQFRALLQQQSRRAVAEYRVRGAHGWLWIESHGMVALRGRDGRVLRLMGTHADISERKRAEEERQGAHPREERSSRVNSNFLAKISHEVRTPLNAIMGLSSLLMDSRLDAEQKNWLGLMNESAQSLLTLLNDVLDFSGIGAGKLQLEDISFQLSRELNEIATLYRQQAAAKSIRFSLTIDPALPVQARGDPMRLRQVLGNLLSNAVKFTDSGGSIEVRADCAVDSGKPWLQLDVEDSGVGIPAGQQATIFDAFTPADACGAPHVGGSGLGLAICSRLVQLMGGRIAVQSEPGRGSCFTVWLPLREETPRAVRSASLTANPAEPQRFEQRFPGLRVLVAEDHPVNELLISRLLERMGCEVRKATNGDEAVAEWERGGLDLVLMDVQMPGTNGEQATQRIRELERERGLRRTPVVAVTANAMHGDKAHYLASGFDSYASKPIDLSALVAAMQGALDAIARATPRAVAAAPAANAPPAGRRPAATTTDTALRQLMGQDDERFQGFAQRLASSLDEEMAMLHKALEERSTEAVRFALHRMGSSLALLSASRAQRVCKGLELSARSGDWLLYERALPLLEQEIHTAFADSMGTSDTPPAG